MKTLKSDLKVLQGERVFLHELSSPLMLVEGWLDRLAKRDPNVAAASEFAQIKTQVEKLRQLLTDRRDQIMNLEKETP